MVLPVEKIVSFLVVAIEATSLKLCVLSGTYDFVEGSYILPSTHLILVGTSFDYYLHMFDPC